MAITTFSSLLPGIRTRLPACPTTLITQSLALSFREFCQMSLGHVVTLTMDATADAKTYTLVPTTDHAIHKVWCAQFRTAAQVTATEKGASQDPYGYRFTLPTTVTFDAAPVTTTVTNGAQFDVALVPQEHLEAFTNHDFDFVNRWSIAIQSGALYRLFSIPDREWSDKDAVFPEFARFEDGYLEARREAYTLYVDRDLRMKSPSFV